MLRTLFRFFFLCVYLEYGYVCRYHGCQENKVACEEEECTQILNTSWQALKLLLHRFEELWLVLNFHLEFLFSLLLPRRDQEADAFSSDTKQVMTQPCQYQPSPRPFVHIQELKKRSGNVQLGTSNNSHDLYINTQLCL